MEQLFKKGDIVELVSGGPKMTVVGPYFDPWTNEYIEDQVDCVWFDDSNSKQEAHYWPFYVSQLRKVATTGTPPTDLLPEIPTRTTVNTSFTPIGSKDEVTFLDGPHSRWTELKFMFKVVREFIYGFRKLHFIGPCVTFFGSARFNEKHPYYFMARQMAQSISKLGFTVMTGGGPGIMEAANRGAKDAGGKSVGCNIILPQEQSPNPYLDLWINLDYFFIRKVLLTKYSYAFIVMPGGYGTMDEFFEALTMIQTGKFQRFPIVLMGKAFHGQLFLYLQKMAAEKTISPEDLKLFLFTDSIEEALAHIERYAVEGFGLKKHRKFKALSILGERKVAG